MFLIAAAVLLGSAATSARASDRGSAQAPNGGSPSGQQGEASAPASRAGETRPRAVFEEVVTTALAPPAPEGEERRAIGESVRKRTDEVGACYRSASAQGKKSNRIVARFDIGPNGKVIGASADGVTDPQFVSCVVSILRKLSFDKPRSGGNLRVAYPFFFTAEAPR